MKLLDIRDERQQTNIMYNIEAEECEMCYNRGR